MPPIAHEQLVLSENAERLRNEFEKKIKGLFCDLSRECVPNEYYLQVLLFQRLQEIECLQYLYSLSSMRPDFVGEGRPPGVDEDPPKYISPLQMEVNWWDQKKGFTDPRSDIVVIEPHWTWYLPGQLKKINPRARNGTWYSAGSSIVFETKIWHWGEPAKRLGVVLDDLRKLRGQQEWIRGRYGIQNSEYEWRQLDGFLNAYIVVWSTVTRDKEVLERDVETIHAEICRNDLGENFTRCVYIGSPTQWAAVKKAGSELTCIDRT